MFNLETKDVKEEFERIKKLGTFADPDNNYFQLVTPWENA